MWLRQGDGSVTNTTHFSQSLAQASRRQCPINISGLQSQAKQQSLSSGLGSDFSTTAHQGQFLGNAPRNIWNDSRECCPTCPGNEHEVIQLNTVERKSSQISWEQKLLMLFNMGVCATLPGTFPGTNCPSLWEPQLLYHNHNNWGETKLGTSTDKQIIWGVWGSRFVSLTMFHIAAEEGGELQPQTRNLQNSYSESVKCRFSKCRFSVLNLKFDFISDGGCTREEQIQKALGSLPPCGNRCRFSESAICSSRVHPPSEIKSNFKFKTLRWRPLRWRLTLSDLYPLILQKPWPSTE